MDHTRKGSPCKRCGHPIIFILSRNGRPMPCDAELFVAQQDDPKVVLVREDGDGGRVQRGVRRGDTGHLSHFATCEFAEEFRRT